MILKTPRGDSRIEVGAGLLDRAGRLLASTLGAPRRVFVLCDGALPRLGLLKRLERALLHGGAGEVHAATIPPGERAKALATAEHLLRHLARFGHERGEPVVALGGGVACDLAGFVAAVYMRGVPLVLVPTTLLAQVDAAIGGKTAVNLPEGKNLVGAFHPARLVVVDPSLLSTLPDREFRGGLAEVVKAGVVADRALFAALRDGAGAVLRRDPRALERVVRAAVRVKAAIVRRDPLETSGARALLNYGHTVGHALEAAASFRGHHGEAVAVGMEAEAWLAERLGVANGSLRERQGEVLDRFGLPRRAPSAPAGRLLEAMIRDKKVRGGRVRFALPVAIGRATFPVTPPPTLIREALRHVARG